MGGDTTDVSDVLIGFPSVVSKHTHTLILGSFPVKASLAVSQYYAHLKNQFWLLMARLFELVHQEDGYGQRVSALLLCGVGIWDVYYRCQRAGSVDAGIRCTVLNDFSCLKGGASALKQVLLNERTAGKASKLVEQYGHRMRVLPSLSSAYTIAIIRKLKMWREAILSAAFHMWDR